MFESIETADTLELMGYLTAVTAFAKRGQERAALGGRAQISIDRSFAPWGVRTVGAMLRALQSAGIGFGEPGAAPGRFYDFPGDPVANGSGLPNNGRRPT